jgi:hypothetical protein
MSAIVRNANFSSLYERSLRFPELRVKGARIVRRDRAIADRTRMNNPARHRAWLEAPPLYEEELGRACPESCARVRDHDLKQMLSTLSFSGCVVGNAEGGARHHARGR